MNPRKQFDRTVCDCQACSNLCRTCPGMLIPGDLQRMAQYLGVWPPGYLGNGLLASPGALVVGRRRGQPIITRIPTIVPELRDGKCVFLDQGRCRVHPVAKRPQANQLLLDARPGDMVLVVSLDRLERGGSRRMFNMLDAFQRKRLSLYALREFGERRVANDTAIDEAFLSLWAFASRWEAEQARSRAKEMHAAYKARNLRHSRYPPIGHRHVEKPHPDKPDKTITVIEPDPIDAAICVEIWRRHKAGWSFPMIANRLGLRDRKGVGGVPWVRRMKSGNSYERLRQAYAAVQKATKEEDNVFAGIPLDGALNGLPPPFCGGSFSLPEWLPH